MAMFLHITEIDANVLIDVAIRDGYEGQVITKGVYITCMKLKAEGNSMIHDGYEGDQ